MDIKQRFATSKDAEENGVWVEIGNDCKILVARSNNKKFAEIFKKLATPYKKLIRMNALSDDKANELMCEAMAKGILLDWEGFTQDGKKLKYTPEKANELFLEMPDFKDLVYEISNEMETFKVEEDKESEKNLPSA